MLCPSSELMSKKYLHFCFVLCYIFWVVQEVFKILPMHSLSVLKILNWSPWCESWLPKSLKINQNKVTRLRKFWSILGQTGSLEFWSNHSHWVLKVRKVGFNHTNEMEHLIGRTEAPFPPLPILLRNDSKNFFFPVKKSIEFQAIKFWTRLSVGGRSGIFQIYSHFQAEKNPLEYQWNYNTSRWNWKSSLFQNEMCQ